jgi:hypothetical protein
MRRSIVPFKAALHVGEQTRSKVQMDDAPYAAASDIPQRIVAHCMFCGALSDCDADAA